MAHSSLSAEEAEGKLAPGLLGSVQKSMSCHSSADQFTLQCMLLGLLRQRAQKCVLPSFCRPENHCCACGRREKLARRLGKAGATGSYCATVSCTLTLAGRPLKRRRPCEDLTSAVPENCSSSGLHSTLHGEHAQRRMHRMIALLLLGDVHSCIHLMKEATIITGMPSFTEHTGLEACVNLSAAAAVSDAISQLVWQHTA